MSLLTLKYPAEIGKERERERERGERERGRPISRAGKTRLVSTFGRKISAVFAAKCPLKKWNLV